MSVILGILLFILKAIGIILLSAIILILLLMPIKVGAEATIDSDSGTAVYLRIGFLRLDGEKLSRLTSLFGKRKSDVPKESKLSEDGGDGSVDTGGTDCNVGEGGVDGVDDIDENIGSKDTVGAYDIDGSHGIDDEDEIPEIPEIPEISEISEISEIDGDAGEGMEKILSYARIGVSAAKRLWGYIDIDIKRLEVAVATDNAADTAILYGEINAAVCGILAYLSNFKNIRTRKGRLDVYCDFYSCEKTRIFLDAVLSFRIWQLAVTALIALCSFLKGKGVLS